MAARVTTADLRTFDIVGRDLNVRATGTLALDETGQSNLTVHQILAFEDKSSPLSRVLKK